MDLKTIIELIIGAIITLSLWRLERKIAKGEAKEEQKEKNQNRFLLALLKNTAASIALSEATAKAVQRIPDAHCNGDMHEALDYAQNVKHELKDFMFEQGVQNMNE